jgi:hypothetical protein
LDRECDAVTTKNAKRSKFERLHELLGLFGNDRINRDQFWQMMKEQNLTDRDIDDYCDGTISAENPEGFLR